jgi:hypothetical protein
MPSGQRYLSTCCEECLDTRKHLLFSYPSSSFASDAADQDLRQMSEYYSRNRGDEPVSNEGLGRHHMGMNVQKCTSFLCKRCQPGDNTVEPIFVPSIAYHAKGDASSKNSSTPLSIFSKKWQPDEEYLPEQAEV